MQSEFYLSIDGNQTGPYTRDELLAISRRGAISAAALYWTEGMADWLPLNQLFSRQAEPPLPRQPPPVPPLKQPLKKKTSAFLILVCAFGALGLFARLFLGVFVIQPIGAIPDGATIVYWRSGLNMPFVASADGLLEESGAGVSLFGRGMFLAKLAEPIKKREIFRIGYSEAFYLWSTGGKRYEK